MAQTPKSVSVGVQGTTNTSIYTVPALKTAVVRAIIGVNSDNGVATFTISKDISGQNFPIITNQIPNVTNATGGTAIRNVNLLTAPITMAAGEQLKAYSAGNSAYSLPSVSSATPTTAADGTNYFIYANLFANGIYMAVGTCSSGAYVATSTDAITWTQRTGALAVASQFNILACNGSVWVATNTADSQGTAYYSSDNGVTWAPAVVVAAAHNFPCLIANGSTFLLSGTNYKLYSSTNGSTWTDITSYTTASGSTTAVIYNLGWTGTHWIVDTQNGALASTDLTTWFGYVGTSLGRATTVVYMSAYSAAYSRYYSTKNVASQPNVFSSTNGYLWQNLASLSPSPYKICCAGTNPVLITVGSGSTADRGKSTDGSTFSLAADLTGRTGPVYGLNNGYFLSMNNAGTNDGCNLSTDPTSVAGVSGLGGLASFALNGAAADPTSGKWIGIGNNGTNIYAIGGSSGTNIGTTYNSTFTTSAYGNPTSVTWSAADSFFYMVTDAGLVFRMTDHNAGWSLRTTSAYPFGSLATTIESVGTTLYLVSTGSTNQVFSSSTLSGGATWGTLDFSAGGGYRRTGDVQRAGNYYGDALATNGTDLVWINRVGHAFALTPSNGIYNMRLPTNSVGTLQTLNSNQFMYGGFISGVGNVQGYFTSTNVITTYGTYVKAMNSSGTSYTWADVQTPPNKMAYIGSTYYITSTAANSLIWNGTTPTTLGTNNAGVGTSFAGTLIVNPNNGWMLDGTNLVSTTSGQQLNRVCKTTSPSNFLYAATMTASIVEID